MKKLLIAICIGIIPIVGFGESGSHTFTTNVNGADPTSPMSYTDPSTGVTISVTNGGEIYTFGSNNVSGGLQKGYRYYYMRNENSQYLYVTVSGNSSSISSISLSAAGVSNSMGSSAKIAVLEWNASPSVIPCSDKSSGPWPTTPTNTGTFSGSTGSSKVFGTFSYTANSNPYLALYRKIYTDSKTSYGGATGFVISSITVTYSYTAGGGCVAPTFGTNITEGTDTYCQNASATALTVASDGATFQWQKSTTSASTGFSDIDDATSASYTPLTTSTGTAHYRCVATKSECSAYSNVRTVTVNANPTISSNVTTGTDNYCNGDGATALSVTSADATFQWQKSTTSSSSGFSNIGGETNASYTPLTTSNGTAYYKCVVTKSGCSTDSNVRTVVVKAGPGLSISLK